MLSSTDLWRWPTLPHPWTSLGARASVDRSIAGRDSPLGVSLYSGEAVLPLDSRFLAGNHTVLLKLSDARGRTRGFVRVEAFWVDEAKPRRETGEFYFRVGGRPPDDGVRMELVATLCAGG